MRATWADAKTVAEAFAVKATWVKRQSERGLVRSAKLGAAKQARRIYAVADIERLLSDMAAAELVVANEGSK